MLLSTMLFVYCVKDALKFFEVTEQWLLCDLRVFVLSGHLINNDVVLRTGIVAMYTVYFIGGTVEQ